MNCDERYCFISKRPYNLQCLVDIGLLLLLRPLYGASFGGNGINLDNGYTLQLSSNLVHKETTVSAICSIQHTQLGPLRRRPIAVGLVILAARCSKEGSQPLNNSFTAARPLTKPPTLATATGT